MKTNPLSQRIPTEGGAGIGAVSRKLIRERAAAQAELRHRARCNGLAVLGKYSVEAERAPA